MGLSSAEQAFVQNLFALKVVTEADAVKLYNQCLEKSAASRKKQTVENPDHLVDRMSKINSQLASLDLQLKTIHSPWDAETYWGLCNTIEDEPSRLATAFTKGEVALFYALVDELREFAGEVKLADAQNVTVERAAAQMSVAETGRTIQKLHQAQWLRIARRSGSGNATVGFGPRALVELPAVRKFVREFAREQAGAGVPSQGRAVEKDEDEEREENEEEVVAVRGRKRRGKRRAVVEEEEEEEEEAAGEEDADMDEYDEEEVRASQARSQSQRPRRNLRRQMR